MLLLIATFLNGSFVVPFKIEPAKTLQPSPLVFMHYMAGGIFITCWLAQAFLPLNDHVIANGSTTFHFIPLGLLSGVVFLLCMLSSFAAVEHIELSLGNGIWSGTTIMTSYLYSLLLFNERPKIIVFSVVGLLLLIGSVLVIANCKELGILYLKKTSATPQNVDTSSSDPENNTVKNPLNNEGVFIEAIDGSTSEKAESASIQSKPKIFAVGAFFAILTGLLGGSALVPLHYINADNQGLTFLPSIGTAALFCPPILLLIRNFYYITCGDENSKKRESLWPDFHFRQLSMYGIASGMVWMTNNVLALSAIPILGYGITLPILQCSTFVGGMWGICFFKEIDDLISIRIFFIGASIMIIGAISLSIGGLHT